jgi:hypothetical protein
MAVHMSSRLMEVLALLPLLMWLQQVTLEFRQCLLLRLVIFHHIRQILLMVVQANINLTILLAILDL